MGLIRYSSPTANSATGTNDWALTGVASAYLGVLDEFRHYTARTAAGGVDTDPCDDTKFIRCIADNKTATFQFAPIVGDDDIARLVIYVRARLFSAGSQDVKVFHRDSGINYDMGTITVNSTIFTDYSISSPSDPGTGVNWTASASELAAGADFGIRVDTFNVGVRVSRMYIAAYYAVGATLGKHQRLVNWRYCDVCGLKSDYDKVQRPVPPHPQSGLVVCPMCYDQPDHETRKIMNATYPRDYQDVLY